MLHKIILTAASIITVLIMPAQQITGTWAGTLQIKKNTLNIVFNISKNEQTLVSTMDSPDQKSYGNPVTSTTFIDNVLTLEIANAKITYKGELKNDTIYGTFSQHGLSLPLNIAKTTVKQCVTKRAQEPSLPYPYISKDVTFKNNHAGITLSGTLTLPTKKGKFAAVVLVSGSGPQNRDEELLGHKPFLILSDYLTRQGIAVLRYDDRGVAKSEGDFDSATTFDLATDAKAAVDFLKSQKNIDNNLIGIAGHSEGGIIAPIVASQYPNDIAFVVMLAGTGIRGDKLLLMQQELINRASGMSDDIVEKSKNVNSTIFNLVLQNNNNDSLRQVLTQIVTRAFITDSIPVPDGISSDEYVKVQIDQILKPWMYNFLKYDPAPTLKNVKCPILAINGTKDLQVPATENLEAIKNALESGGNKQFSIKKFDGLNHLFQECETGLPTEYAQIEQTISPVVLSEISNWIKQLNK